MVAAYTGNFTPPTQPLQATPQTQLLLRSQRALTITNNQGGGGTQMSMVGNVQIAGSLTVNGAPVISSGAQPWTSIVPFLASGVSTNFYAQAMVDSAGNIRFRCILTVSSASITNKEESSTS